MILPYLNPLRLKDGPIPVPMALTRSFNSWLAKALAKGIPSLFRILPRRGKTAWFLLLRPCLAEPPAPSPSTRKSSVSSTFVLLQSANFPGKFSRRVEADLRFTSLTASRLAWRARAANTIRPTMASAAVLLAFSQLSSAGRTELSTCAVISVLFSRSLVCP